MREAIQVKYSCAGCGLHRVVVTVAARTQEPVVEWVEKIMAQAISNDHSQRSPHCASRTMSEVMIPIEGNDGSEAAQVGGVLRPKKVQ
jgi:hypothetical protein